ncbi:MAG: response regulator [Microscillaceae bacterium]|jgi:CheY-like chemotaxis protein|nr:response regulator [Microscillaceae bacterium]
MAKHKHTILCVDDEKIVLDSLKTQLRTIFGDDFHYEVAQNGSEALEVVDEMKEDNLDVLIVISDYIMPGMYGDEFLIKLHQKYPQIRKIMLTGQADDNAVKRAREKANLLFCLRKPWTKEELAKIIKAGIS